MANNVVGWFGIYVQNMDRAKRFYETVFECELQSLHTEPFQMWAFSMSMEGYGASGALVKMDGFPSGRNSTIVYFSCKDCAVEAARAVAAGGRIQKDKMSIGQYGFIALVYDTESNLIGLHSMQ